MAAPEILSYVAKERVNHTPDATIKSALIENGWNAAEVNEAMSATGSSAAHSSADREKLKKFRRRQTHIIFGWSMLVIFLLFLIELLTLNSGQFSPTNISNFIGSLALFLIPVALVVYASSYIATRGSVPHPEKSKEIGGIVLRVIGSLLLALVLSVGIFFAACLFIVVTYR